MDGNDRRRGVACRRPRLPIVPRRRYEPVSSSGMTPRSSARRTMRPPRARHNAARMASPAAPPAPACAALPPRRLDALLARARRRSRCSPRSLVGRRAARARELAARRSALALIVGAASRCAAGPPLVAVALALAARCSSPNLRRRGPDRPHGRPVLRDAARHLHRRRRGSTAAGSWLAAALGAVVTAVSISARPATRTPAQSSIFSAADRGRPRRWSSASSCATARGSTRRCARRPRGWSASARTRPSAAALEERTRIAGELHDVVAHALSAMTSRRAPRGGSPSATRTARATRSRPSRPPGARR